MEPLESEISLFPLHLVLFPTMVLPLRIFEERYKLMLRACLEADRQFGVVLIKEGEEVGTPAIPYTVGTLARIHQVTPVEDGQFHLLVMGERRFHLLEVTEQYPYLKGRVQFVHEEIGEPQPTSEEIGAVRQALEKYLRSLLGLRGGWTREVPSPTDPVGLSFYLGAVLGGEATERQRILEAPTARERLALLTPLLQRENEHVQAVLKERVTPKGESLN